MSAQEKTDAIIIGGGLAGLTLAMQLKRRTPHLALTVVERNRFPIPEKTSKVGESTVELGSHYLKETLGLAKHFNERHLRKHGLRCFFGTPQSDFSKQDELGVSQLFGIPTYQIDRGAIENQLHTQLVEMGVNIINGASIVGINPTGSTKSVTLTFHDSTIESQHSIQGRWLVDAAGRQNFLKSSLNLGQQVDHKGNAVWFRIDRQVKLDDWSDNDTWKARLDSPGTRWLSTNHLMGPGYWVWVIPLDNGATSFGIVGDDTFFAANDFSSFKSTFRWLRENHPHCAESIAGAEVLDFVAITDYAHGCKQVFSDDCWGISGEAGVFTDPFYSPGTDFIALGNTFLTQLLSDECSGSDIRLSSRVYERLYQSFYASTLSLYQGQYGGFGDRGMMSLKLVWDYAYYWGVLTLLFYRQAITNIALMREISKPLERALAANQRVQGAFRQRALKRQVLPANGVFMDQFQIPCLKHLNLVLGHSTMDVQPDLLSNIDMLERLSACILALLQPSVPPPSLDEQELLGDYRAAVLF